jgi:alkylation response protein AidB-like acyl-CoA dehydrogenase
VVAVASSGLGLFAVEGDASGVTRVAQPVLDQTRPLARLVFADVEARQVAEVGSVDTILEKTFDTAVLLLGAEQLGAAQRCLEMAIGYAQDRRQFDRQIGSFQAIKQKCTDMFVLVESCRSAVYYAAWSAAAEDPGISATASLVKAYCSDALFRVAGENIQIHGGIGYTWEHPAHLYMKRAAATKALFGSPTFHRERLVAKIGI